MSVSLQLASTKGAGRRWPAVLRRLLAAGSLFPTALIVALYSFVVRARLELGRWPIPYQPDPKELAVADAHFDLIGWLGLVTFASFLPWCLMAVIGWRVLSLSRSRAGCVALVAPWLILAAVITWDPGRFVAWIMD